MKKTISSLLLLLLSQLGWSMDYQEEAVVLNQELEYLKEAAKVPAIQSAEPAPVLSEGSRRGVPSRGLEETYFGTSKTDDTVTTRAAARRRNRTDE